MAAGRPAVSPQRDGDAAANPGADVAEQQPLTVIAGYRFVPIDDVPATRDDLESVAASLGLRGTILLAEEGINATIAGPSDAIDAFLAQLEADSRFRQMPWKRHSVDQWPFERLKVKHKSAIIRMDGPPIDLARRGQRVDAKTWDTLLADEDVLVIDTRNDYEVAVGTFAGAVNPKTRSFTEFPAWADRELPAAMQRQPKAIAMFCTGGIRCEKATALVQQWLDAALADRAADVPVFHLDGGILQYLADTHNASGRWQGECFVFDDRVAVDANLQPGETRICERCSMPLEASDAGQKCRSCKPSADASAGSAG